ncbi:MAG: molybdopterin converting factor subunit 1 [Gammaproteobacteria bacterium]|uniref:molybdopterin converting factor subunit 1 n=1 Tax=Pseudomaricurvus alcaniphilus TaxID=1166482 RepID=UPI00140C022E|nr:molybdopterin converting factor subunit 1 [Pseudomaricurvus alcaniphilus]MBR9911050.1 molybdopterin converting factor subunit 1 [Gammaproteobacteria bacterium]NHN37757.1 molybdopterin converting factor subunit 1 [Pseudomaricurvus alcaniphilus]
MIRIKYFARLREAVGQREESLPLPESVATVTDLRDFLGRRDEAWQQAMQMGGLLVAVNQTVVDWNQPLSGDEEVAFFPPVTGG